MVKDAELNAEEDKKLREVVDARNQLDALTHQVKKSLTEHGDKIDAAEKSAIEAALKDAEEALKGNDKDDIEAKTQALSQASHKLAEKMYADAGQAGGAGPEAAAGGGSGGSKADDGDVVDAEFEEVKDRK
jgi:molecular chaperone DnaK